MRLCVCVCNPYLFWTTRTHQGGKRCPELCNDSVKRPQDTTSPASPSCFVLFLLLLDLWLVPGSFCLWVGCWGLLVWVVLGRKG